MITSYIHEKLTWVCVIEYPDKPYHILTTKAPTVVAQPLDQPVPTSSGKLLYYRRFYDITSAEKHKLMLNRISQTSLEATIRRLNPQKEDLTHTLLDQMG